MVHQENQEEQQVAADLFSEEIEELDHLRFKP